MFSFFFFFPNWFFTCAVDCKFIGKNLNLISLLTNIKKKQHFINAINPVTYKFVPNITSSVYIEMNFKIELNRTVDRICFLT